MTRPLTNFGLYVQDSLLIGNRHLYMIPVTKIPFDWLGKNTGEPGNLVRVNITGVSSDTVDLFFVPYFNVFWTARTRFARCLFLKDIISTEGPWREVDTHRCRLKTVFSKGVAVTIRRLWTQVRSVGKNVFTVHTSEVDKCSANSSIMPFVLDAKHTHPQPTCTGPCKIFSPESTRSISLGNRFSCSDNPGFFSDFSIDSTRTAHGLSLLCRPSASSSPLGVGKIFGRNAFELRSSVASIASWRAAEFSELLQHLEQLHRSQ